MKIEKSWEMALSKFLPKNFFLEMEAFLDQEIKKNRIVYPQKEEIYQGFFLTPFDKVKVVILGQDPYHGEEQAHGLAFSVRKEIKIPPSLRNIFKELKRDIGVENSTHGNLESWALQGVFLYNTCLSVLKDSPFSHKNKGWEVLSEAVFKALSEKTTPVVFMFWGKAALHYKKFVEFPIKENFLILESAHPSPLSCKGFLGSSHFSKANQFLEKWGEKPINWII
jgi:uracil-DNA glycosylase